VKQRIANLLIAVLFLFGLFAFTQPAAAQPGNTPGRDGMIQGYVSLVDTTANTLTIAPKRGADVVLKIDASTVIYRARRKVALTDILIGDRVQAKYNKTTLVAKRIEAEKYLGMVKGLVSAVDSSAKTVTVKPVNGKPSVVLNVADTTLIRRDGKKVTLAGLQVGDMLLGIYNPVSKVALRLIATHYVAAVEGAVKVVDSTAGTLTITPKRGTDLVLSIATTTVITRNAASAALSDLVVGDLVKARYNAVTLLATQVTAWVPLAQIQGVISAVDTGALTLTVKPISGDEVVLSVNPSTVIKRQDAPATLADLLVGDLVQAKYDATSKVAASVSARPAPDIAEVHGTISAVDAAAGTVTLTPKDGGADIVLSVNGETKILLNLKPATLADLHNGDFAEAVYSPATLTARGIMAMRKG
jgi:hypothetical protein